MDKPIILIAVDDEGARRSIAELLHGQGYDVLDAAGRSEVMACVHERAPDLVIVGSFRDATWDALEVAREVRKTDRMLPVIMVNGRSAEDLAIAAVKAGITDYFKPPISFGELTASISGCLADFALGVRSAALTMSEPDVTEKTCWIRFTNPLYVERRTYASSCLRNLRALRMAGAAVSQCTTNRG